MSQSVPSRRNVLAGALGIGAFGAAALSAESAAAALGDPTLPEAPTRTFYLKVAGPAVDGSVTARGYERQIELLTWGWGVSVATSAGGGVGRATPDPLLFAAYSDIHSPKLSQSAHTGRRHTVVTLTCLAEGSASPRAFMTLQFSDVTFTDYYVTPHPVDGRPLDVFQLKMTRISQSFVGPTGTPVSMSFDYATGSAIPTP